MLIIFLTVFSTSELPMTIVMSSKWYSVWHTNISFQHVILMHLLVCVFAFIYLTSICSSLASLLSTYCVNLLYFFTWQLFNLVKTGVFRTFLHLHKEDSITRERENPNKFSEQKHAKLLSSYIYWKLDLVTTNQKA
jgi:hypothetical protein